MKSYSSYFYKVLFLLGKDKRKLFSLLILFLISSFLDMLGIGLLAPFIALATNPELVSNYEVWFFLMKSIGVNKPITSIFVLGLIIITLFFIKALMAVWVKKKIANYSLIIQSKLTCRLMSAYQNMPYQFHLKRNTASLIQATSNHTSNFSHHTLMQGLGLISELFVVIMLVTLLATTSLLTLITMSFILTTIYYFYDRIIRNRVTKAGEDVSIANESIIKGVTQGIEGLREIRVYGSELYFYNKVKDFTKKFAEVNTELNGLKIIPRYLFETTIITFIIGVILIKISNSGDSSNLLHLMGVFGLASIRLVPSASKVSSAIISMRHSKFSVHELFKDINELNYITPKSIHLNSNSLDGKDLRLDFSCLEIKNINYFYENKIGNVISDLSLSIKKNESIGIMGKSGSGKTTLINILLGLLTPQSGSIEANGVSIQDSLRSWLNIIAYIPQDVFILDDSIQKNIAIGIPDEKINKDKLSQSIFAAQLDDVIKKLPENINTIVGQRGIRLSGGERQRLALARAFYNEREVIIMDEATSALDSETEQLLVDAINKLKVDKTIIMIAHRLTTLKDCDVIYEIENGKIINSGDYSSVLKN